MESDKDGNPLLLSVEERSDNEDELIQICHKLWLEGEPGFDYSQIDSGSDSKEML